MGQSQRTLGGWAIGEKRSVVHQFVQEDLDTFARLTGDHNPLHMDDAFARTTEVGGRVVHGMLVASYVSTLVGMHIPGEGALWNGFQVNWRKPIRLGARIVFEISVTGLHASTNVLDLEIVARDADTGDIHMDGKATVMVMKKREPRLDSHESVRRVLVTGATGEVGSAICRRLAAEGASVAAWGRDQERLNALARNTGDAITSVSSIDLSDSSAIESGIAQVLEGGPVAAFIHAAAPPMAPTAVTDAANEEVLNAHWSISVRAFAQVVRAVAPAMTNGGAIVAVLTQAIFDAPPPRLSAYVASKLAVWGLIRSLAVELGPRGIRCNAVSPGMINTPYTADVPVRLKQVEAASNPLRRLCDVEDVAEAVAFLCGPTASFINGVNLPVNGGLRMP